jgi:cytoskeleton protein RodZ
MTLEEFGQELRAQRAARNVSLTDIAAETRINQKFLEAIERGAFSVLPQAYIRAFLREYASAVGLTPDDVLRTYESAGGALSPAPAPKPEPAASPGASTSASPSAIPASWRPYLFGGAVVVAVVVVMVLLMNGVEPSSPVSSGEIPFDRVIRETEAALPADSIHRFVSAAPAPAPILDSLTLEMTTVDSVWINIVVDDRTAEDFLFAPNRRRIWKARDRFTVTMGNAGGATFRLNGKELGALGRRGAVLRNSILTADLLR